MEFVNQEQKDAEEQAQKKGLKPKKKKYEEWPFSEARIVKEENLEANYGARKRRVSFRISLSKPPEN